MSSPNKSPSGAGAITLLLVDQHALCRKGVACLLASRPRFRVVGQTGDGEEALELARRLGPDLVLAELELPGIHGIELTRRLAAELPEVKVVILTGSDQDEELFEAVKSGAAGYLAKTTEPEELFSYLEGVSQGEAAISGRTAARILKEFAGRPGRETPPRVPEAARLLTARELEVLALVASGATNREIASSLTLTQNTVKNHVRSILEKLGLDNRVQATSYALRHGLAPFPRGDAQPHIPSI